MKLIQKTLIFMTALALFVVMLGAYTRLTDAGLGCPDWPGCYGKLVLPSDGATLQTLQNAYPDAPLESPKAWTEMAHRYVAGTLGLLIFFVGIASIIKRSQGAKIALATPIALMIIVLFQALLGMWTVTLKLLPIVVMAHLCGGILIFSLIARFLTTLSLEGKHGSNCQMGASILWLPIVFVFVQIALGGWVSANYAGLSCIGFPSCNGMYWPALNFSEGFYLFSPVGENYQGGLLASTERMTIQWVHRMFALAAVLVTFISCVWVYRHQSSSCMKRFALLPIVLIGVQVMLGIMNVVYLLPLSVAVLHNGVAAMLLASLLSLQGLLRKGASCSNK